MGETYFTFGLALFQKTFIFLDSFPSIVCNVLAIIFMQKYGPLESQWDSVKKLITLLRSFQGFANKVPT